MLGISSMQQNITSTAAHLKLLDLVLVLDSPLDGSLCSVLELAVNRLLGERHCSRGTLRRWQRETSQRTAVAVRGGGLGREGADQVHSPICIRKTAVAVIWPIGACRHRSVLHGRRRGGGGGWERASTCGEDIFLGKGASCLSG